MKIGRIAGLVIGALVGAILLLTVFRFDWPVTVAVVALGLAASVLPGLLIARAKARKDAAARDA
ncbi:ABC-type uncharacterized transport system permease subunit [Microbacterium sp. SORGH_AS 505]|uniref:hypothetical protein n=1 Tax=Microbacterium sp. SORGH_AS_0505 TaxID=3041770 RepID=UPI00278117DF|nr:hypothetical protein [Microbacterium sp. SORGH_AS_0505]MDQ1125911.1 ABC-type uncharacterized transport system permease subunit [Microbacterium sp. SORGH_AS_0505]